MNPLRPLKGLLFIVVSLGGLAGWLSGSLSLGVILVLLLLLAHQFYQQQRLIIWLRRDDQADVPEAGGTWGEIFNRLHRTLQRHRHLEAQLKSVIDRIQDSTQALRDGVLMVDSQGEIEWWNRAASRLLGLKRPQDVGQPVTNLVRDPRFVHYFEERDYRDPLELASPADRGRHLQFTITEFGRSERLVLVRDITRLNRLERMRQDFVGNASHELRTPLTVISGYLETLQDQFADNVPVNRALQQMDHQARRMNNLVNDMLMLSRLETTDSQLDNLPIDLERLLAEVSNSTQVLAEERGHQLILDLEPGYRLLGQEKELFSAFSNLVSNAIKYTTEPGQVRIRWRVDKRGGHLEVEDTGMGIEPQHLNRLTERFYRVDDGRASHQGGTGLGLAIVKHVLLRHQAQLSIQSTPDQGSTFSCHFPLRLLQPVPDPISSPP